MRGAHHPYPDYSVADAQWFPAIPSHWAFAKCGQRFEVMLGKMLDSSRVIGNNLGRYLRNTDVQWDLINEDDLPQMDFSPGERERYLVQKGDLLVCEGGEIGRSAIWTRDYSCYYQKALHRLRPHRSSRDSPRFMFYSLALAVKQSRFIAGAGAATIAHLPAESLRRYRFAFPPFVEQIQIAKFLDYETARIDALIEKQQQLIALLKEKRQAVISHAVTKGLNPNAPMRDSGVEWLGDVPAHWRCGKMKYFASLRSGHTPSRSKPEYWEDCFIPWFSLADVWQLRDGKQTFLGETKESISELGLANSAAELLPAGTVVLSRTASVGFSGIMPVPMATTQDFVNWVPGDALSSTYLLFVFRAMAPEFERLKMGSTHKTIYMPDAMRFSCPLPPSDEQSEIVDFLARKVQELEDATNRARDLVDLLQERRTALISAAVTGKIDVRSWQPPASGSAAA